MSDIEFIGYSEIRVVINKDDSDAGIITRKKQGIVWRPSRCSFLTVEQLQTIIDVMKKAHSLPIETELK